MKKTKLQKNRLLLAPLALLAIVLIFVFLERSGVTNLSILSSDQAATSGPTKEQKKQEADINAANKQQFIEGAGQKPSTNTPPSPTSSPGKSIELTAKQEANNTVTVFTKLPGYSSGTCNLTVTNGGNSVDQTAPLMYQAEYSTCAGFSVPISGLGNGTWSIRLAATSNETTESKTIIYGVQ